MQKFLMVTKIIFFSDTNVVLINGYQMIIFNDIINFNQFIIFSLLYFILTDLFIRKY